MGLLLNRYVVVPGTCSSNLSRQARPSLDLLERSKVGGQFNILQFLLLISVPVLICGNGRLLMFEMTF